ncbi:MAG: DUF4838 domain-containing protein [Planctomycetota bacterium]|nr:DUF4838 domain-containing protein [Planctomycetota bacterium]
MDDSADTDCVRVEVTNAKGLLCRGGMFALFLLSNLSLTIMTGNVEADITLVRNGQPNCFIVLARKATRSAQLGARELQEHVRLMTGAELSILSEDEDLPKEMVPVYVGESEATRMLGLLGHRYDPQESLVRIEDERVVFIGRDDLDFGPISYEKNGAWPGFKANAPFHQLGSLRAVHDFLENLCGVRWFMVTDLGRVVPKKKSLKFKQTERRFKPWTYYRMLGRHYWGVPGIAGKYDGIVVRYHMKGFHTEARDNNLFALRLRRGAPEKFWVGHSTYKYQQRFGKEHPEWFMNGIPSPHVRLHHPGFIEQYVKDGIEFFDKRKGRFFAAMPADGAQFDDTSEPPIQPDRIIKRWRGTSSNHVFTWVNTVAKKIREVHTHALISTCAYSSYAYPPDFDLEQNVSVTVANYGGDMSFILDLWRKRVSRLMTWEYQYPWGRSYPPVRTRQMSDYIKMLRKLNVEGMFREMGDMNAALYHLDYYVAMKMLVDQKADAESIMKEYYPLFYGPAAAPMKRFWENIMVTIPGVMKEHDGVSTKWKKVVTSEKMAELDKHLKRADASAREEPYISRIRIMRTGIYDFLKQEADHFASFPDLLTLAARKTTTPPRLDGKLDDAVWQQAEKTKPFVTSYNNPVETKTHGMVSYDDENLYLAVWAEEPDMAAQKLNFKPVPVTEGMEYSADDHVEFFLKAEGRFKDRLCVQVTANSAIWVHWPGKYGWARTVPVDLGIRGKAWRGEKEYSLELTIPFAKVTDDGKGPRPGDVWRLDMARARHVPKKRKYKGKAANVVRMWAPTMAFGGHFTDRWGLLKFKE